MKQLVHFSRDQFGSFEFEFESAPEEQKEEGVGLANEISTIDNDEVVERYEKALEEFEAAHEAVVYVIEPIPCSTCRHFRKKVCDVDKTETTREKCCNYYHRGFVHEWDQ